MRDLLALTEPYHQAPLHWRQYQAALLRAERLYRTGRLEEATRTLALVRERLEPELFAPHRATVHPWSLATLRAQILQDQYDEAIQRAKALLRSGKSAEAKTLLTQASASYSTHRLSLDQPIPSTPSASGTLGEWEGYQHAIDDVLRGRPEPLKPAAVPAEAPPNETPKETDSPDGTEPPKAEEAPASTPPPAPDLKTGPSPVEVLALNNLPDTPRFLEGQVALWYGRFAEQGGESEGLRDDRQVRLRRATKIRENAEQAIAFDERIGRWIRPAIEEGDEFRRQAQDVLFASAADRFREADAPLNNAENRYDQALTLARSLHEALDLVQRLQDELPYYGEWMAASGDIRDENFEQLLDGAGNLALEISEQDKPPADLLGWTRHLDDQTTALRRRRDALAREFDQALRTATGRAGTDCARATPSCACR